MNAQPRITQPLVHDPLANEELRERVLAYLTHTGHQPLRSLQVEAADGIVTLRGRLPTFFARQLAVACACRVAGVRHVVDLIQIASLKPEAGRRAK